MKTKIHLFIILIIFSNVVDIFAESNMMNIPNGKLTLKKAHYLALVNNPGIKSSLEVIEQAISRTKQAKSTLKPSLSFSGNYNKTNGTQQLDWAPHIRATDGFNQYGFQLNFSYLLYDGLERKSKILAAESGVKQKEQMHFEVKRLLLEAVSVSFMQALLASETMRIEKSNYDFNHKLEKESVSRWQVGEIPESETLNFSLRKIQAETNYLNAKSNFSIACTILAELLAFPDAQLPKGMYPSNNFGKTLKVDFNVKEEFDYALKNRPDLSALDFSKKSLNHELDAVKSSYKPKVSVVSGMGYSGLVGLANIDQHENQTFVGVQATYDLYRNGRRKSQIEEFESSIRGLEHQKSKSILNIRSMLNQQIYQAETAFKILKKQKKVLKISRKIREHVQKQYGEGEVNLTRLNEVQNDLIRAAGSVAASGVSLKLLLVQIDSTTGRILEGFLPNMVKK